MCVESEREIVERECATGSNSALLLLLTIDICRQLSVPRDTFVVIVMSSYARADSTREDKLLALKTKLASVYASNLIPPPDEQSPLSPVRRDDPVHIKKSKNEQNRKKIAARQAYYKEHEANAVAELEAIMNRIRTTLSDIKAVGNLFTEGTGAVHEIRSVCTECGNTDPYNVFTDAARGERVCTGRDGKGCGQILQDNVMMQGMERRNFDETEDHAHYGPAPNPLMPDTVNLQTKMSTYMYGKEKNPAWNRYV